MRWPDRWQYRRRVVTGRRAVLLDARALRPARPDVIVALAISVVVVAATAGFGHWHPQEPPLDALGALWLLGCTVPLLWRCRAPLVVLALTSLATFTYYQSGYPHGPAVLGPTLALAALAYLRGPVTGAVAAAVLAVAEITQVLVAGDAAGTFDPRLIGFVLWVAVAVCAGTFGRLRRTAMRSAAERAAEADRLRAEEQRLRIAREVHDVVAHSLAMINVQAGVGRARRRPAAGEAKEALLAIKEASRVALVDLRATLAVLRGTGDDGRLRRPRRLPGLVAAVAAGGCGSRATATRSTVPAPVDVAAYRILQESLTNVSGTPPGPVRSGSG